ncbi:MAG: HAD hydrolase-like protein [Sphingobacteriaceae bacterium]|nr:HAD hydrolase-like protein [Sphingobacteriaceae bacterium]
MSINNYLNQKNAFLFELDNVLYPEKDYLLQIYYLFANFIESEKGMNAIDILEFMKKTYFEDGSEDIFTKTAEKFSIPKNYQKNFDLLHENVRLPLKLLLFEKTLTFLEQIKSNHKQIFLFIKGNPAQQINKIKQIEWNHLEADLIVYFTEESTPQITLEKIIKDYNLTKSSIIYIGADETSNNFAKLNDIDFAHIQELN